MTDSADTPAFADWCAAQGLRDVTPVTKESRETTAWFASGSDGEIFLKLYPPELAVTRGATECAIAGGGLHPAIVPLRGTAHCREGLLLLYDRAPGENLGSMAARTRFQALPTAERIRAVRDVIGALAAITAAGFMVVDWYEGNMLYDFDWRRIRLFDWDLCRPGDGFTLEMASNYGSSRLMAPEEFVRGSRIDGRTLVFNLGRYTLLTLPELAETLAAVLARATHPARAARYPTVRDFAEDLDRALPPSPHGAGSTGTPDTPTIGPGMESQPGAEQTEGPE